MFDAREKVVEILIDDTKVWINVDGKCEVRVYDATEIIIEDKRNNDNLKTV